MLTLERRTYLQFLLTLFLVSGLFWTAAAQNPPGESLQPSTTGWKIKFDGSRSSPVIVDGVLYVGSEDGAVYALDPKTGDTKWRFQTGESLSSSSGAQVISVPRGTSLADQMAAGMKAADKQRQQGTRKVEMTPAVENGTVFIGSEDLSFYAIDAATGKKKWSYEAGPGMASNAATVKNGTVYFVTEDGLYALDALTGTKKWLFETWQANFFDTKHGPQGPVWGDGLIFLTLWAYLDPNTQKGFLYAVDPESGKAKWVTSVAGLVITPPATAKGLAFFAVEEPGPTPTSSSNRATLYAVNAADGQVKWKFGVASPSGAPPQLIAGGTIYTVTDKSVFALELDTGRQLWTFNTDVASGTVFEEGAGLWADDQHLYVVTHAVTRGNFSQFKLHALTLTAGQEKWSQSLSNYANIAMVHDGVVYASRQQFEAIDAATGKELWSFKGTGRESPRLMSGGRIFLTSPTVDYIGTKKVDQGYLYAIDAKTGKLKP